MTNIDKFFKDGKLKVIPRKEKNKLEILDYYYNLLTKLNVSVFSEKEINHIISESYSDYAIIRRYLVDYGYIKRDKYGKEYWLDASKQSNI